MELEVSRDKVQLLSLVHADACLVLAALRANLLGLGQVMLDTHLTQAVVIRLPRFAWFGRRLGITGRGRGRHDGKVDLFDREEMPLAGGVCVPFPPRSENIAAVEIELVTQVVDRLLLFLDSLLVELGGLFECGAVVVEYGLEVRDLLSVTAQQIVAFAGISGP
jgi:hypothetical protein